MYFMQVDEYNYFHCIRVLYPYPVGTFYKVTIEDLPIGLKQNGLRRYSSVGLYLISALGICINCPKFKHSLWFT